MPLFTSGGLGLVTLVLDLGLKNLVLFTSLDKKFLSPNKISVLYACFIFGNIIHSFYYRTVNHRSRADNGSHL